MPISVVSTKRVQLTKLQTYPGNPRRGNTALIAESLRAHGQFRPLVVNQRTNQVLAGNHTLLALREMGETEALVSFIDVTDEQAAKIVLVDNRSSDIGRYDDSALAELLEGLGGDLDATGYTDADVEALLKALEPPADFQDPEVGLTTTYKCPSCGYRWSGGESNVAA